MSQAPQSNSKTVKIDLKDGEEKKKKDEKEIRLDRLQSRLTHLKGIPYYKGHLDLSPGNLRRWLDDADDSVLLAAARLRASVAQRKKINRTCRSPSFTQPHAMEDHLGAGICGVDRQGSLVYFLLFGRTDMLGILKSCSREQMMVYWALEFQRMIDCLKEHEIEGKKVKHNLLLIVDLHGCGPHSFCWPVLCTWAKAMQLYEDLNPGLFKEILLINPPVALPVIHKFLSWRLKHSTKQRVTVLGTTNMLRHLLIRVAQHEIPAYLGGYKCDVDNNPNCRQYIVWPEKVPRWMYQTNPYLSADVMDVAVDAGKIYKEKLTIPVVGTRIVWQLYNVTHPVTLMMTAPDPPPATDSCRDLLTKPRPLATARLKAQEPPQGGAISCSRPGTYCLVLDNRKDLMHMVRAKVKVDVLPPVGYVADFARRTPVGHSVNFSEPVTKQERQMRKDLVLRCQSCPTVDLGTYY